MKRYSRTLPYFLPSRWAWFKPAASAPARVMGPGVVAGGVKRAMDILGGLAGLLFSIPILGLAGVLISLDDGGPIFFLQARVGKNGKIFRMIKLRTMRPGAEADLPAVLPFNCIQGPAYKIFDDPRITRTGKFLRRWSIDELPQFINVLQGAMSLVGPRPEQVWEVEKYSPEQSKRLAVKPGLTGPMQVNGRGLLDGDTRLRLDTAYVEHYSIFADLAILVRTVPAIISGKGAF